MGHGFKSAIGDACLYVHTFLDPLAAWESALGIPSVRASCDVKLTKQQLEREMRKMEEIFGSGRSGVVVDSGNSEGEDVEDVEGVEDVGASKNRQSSSWVASEGTLPHLTTQAWSVHSRTRNIIGSTERSTRREQGLILTT